MKTSALSAELARAYRASSGKILAVLAKRFADLQLAEDALQDALLQAQEQWAKEGLPRDPAAWLFTCAHRRLLDRLRREKKITFTQETNEREQSVWLNPSSLEGDQPIPDERLSLIFVCCHPALSQEARVALTLKTLCGLSAREIARAFLVSESAMRRRLSRAKKKIKANSIPYAVPTSDQLSIRLDSVLSVIYLIFNESYTAFEGQTLTRDNLASEALRLSNLVVTLLPNNESLGLLALMQLHQSRRPARCGEQGQMIPLQYQDRSLWDQDLIEKGLSTLARSVGFGSAGRFQLQAAISAVHSKSKTWETSDWNQIVALYRRLCECDDSPVVKLNLYAAVSFSGAPRLAKLGMLDLQDGMLGYQPFYALLADIEARLGNRQSALDAISLAIELSNNEAERQFLKEKEASLQSN